MISLKPGRTAAFTMVVLLLIGLWTLGSTLLSINNIRVESDIELTDAQKQQIIQLSGLTEGQNLLSIDHTVVRTGIDSDPYTRFISLSRSYTSSSVLLRVRVVQPSAFVKYFDSLLLIDTFGNIMDKIIVAKEDLPYVMGLSFSNTEFMVGDRLRADNPEAITAMLRILDELRLMNIDSRISELNVKNLDNLYLVTEDGLTVMLGDALDLAEKVHMTYAVLEQLPDLRASGQIPETTRAVLEVTAPLIADLRWADDQSV